MSGSIYDADQPIVSGVVVGITDTTTSVSGVKAIATAASEAPVYVFSSNYTTLYNGFTLSFRYGVPYQLDAKLLAFLTAASAPITAA